MRQHGVDSPKLTLATLPLEILILFFSHLDPAALSCLSLASRQFLSLVHVWGWQSRLRYNHKISQQILANSSLKSAPWISSSKAALRYIHLTEQGWNDRSFVARPLNNPWFGKLHPILLLDNEASHLAIAAGRRVYSYRSAPGRHSEPTTLHFAGEISFRSRQPTDNQEPQRPIDITGFALLPGSISAFVGFDSGHLKQIKLPNASGPNHHTNEPDVMRVFDHPPELIRSLNCQDQHLVSYSTTGLLSLYSINDSSPKSTLRKSVTRGWSTYFNTSSNVIAVGSASSSPLLVYSVHPSGISKTPLANLGRGMKPLQRKFAVYDITGPPSGFPGGQSDQIIISSWFDGKVRVHDLRDSFRGGSYPDCSGIHKDSDAPTPLLPCQVLYDPWTTGDAKYSVSAGGPCGACIASGSATNSVICLWDVRQPDNGWSVHAPGNDRSPIYSLQLDYSRIWCANQSRACVIDFGPDVSLRTYPLLQRTPRSLPPKPGTGGLSYLAMYYSHKHESPGPPPRV